MLWAKNANITCDDIEIFKTSENELALKALKDINYCELAIQVPEKNVLSLEYGKTTPLKYLFFLISLFLKFKVF